MMVTVIALMLSALAAVAQEAPVVEAARQVTSDPNPAASIPPRPSPSIQVIH